MCSDFILCGQIRASAMQTSVSYYVYDKSKILVK